MVPLVEVLYKVFVSLSEEEQPQQMLVYVELASSSCDQPSAILYPRISILARNIMWDDNDCSLSSRWMHRRTRSIGDFKAVFPSVYCTVYMHTAHHIDLLRVLHIESSVAQMKLPLNASPAVFCC